MGDFRSEVLVLVVVFLWYARIGIACPFYKLLVERIDKELVWNYICGTFSSSWGDELTPSKASVWTLIMLFFGSL